MEFERPECYICRTSPEGCLRDFIARWDLISPCKCNGSIAHVHRSCLEDWLLARSGSAATCEICKTDYVLEFTVVTRVLIVLHAYMHTMIFCVAITLSVFLTWITLDALGVHEGGVQWGLAMAFVALIIYVPLLVCLQWLYRDFRKMKRIADSRATWTRWLDEKIFAINASD